jgi:hypothetical protein
MTGIEYPTISVGEHENLTVRMSLAAQVLMRRRGIDPAKIGQMMLAKIVKPNEAARLQTDPPTIAIDNPDAVTNVIAVFSCMVAENFVDKRATKLDLNTAPTADYWATQIDDFAAVEKAVWDAVGKAVEARRAKLAAVPPMESQAS